MFFTQQIHAVATIKKRAGPVAHCSTNYELYGHVTDNIACTLATVDMKKNDRRLEMASEDGLPIVFYAAGEPQIPVAFSSLTSPRRYTYRMYR